MVKVDNSDISENVNQSCSAEASSYRMATDNIRGTDSSVNGEGETPACSQHCSSEFSHFMEIAMETAMETYAVNGHTDKMSAKALPSSDGNRSDEVPAKDISVATGNFSKKSGNHLNGFQSENESSSANNLVGHLDLPSNDPDESGYTIVTNGKKNKKKIKDGTSGLKQNINQPPVKHRENIKHDKVIYKNSQATSSDASSKPPRKNISSATCPKKSYQPVPHRENIKHDKVIDKNSQATSSDASSKPPRKNISSATCPKKSYSSVVSNGQNGKHPQTRGNVSPCAQNVIKSNSPVNGKQSLDQLKTEVAQTNNTSVVSCKQSTELSEMSTQQFNSSENEICSMKQCLDYLPESNKPSSPSDYIDSGEISDESSNPTYSESVVSADSGTGGGEDCISPFFYEFPRDKVSQLIGRHGSFKKEIEYKSGVQLLVVDNAMDESLSIIRMIGKLSEVEKARELIKARFRDAALPQWNGYPMIDLLRPTLDHTFTPLLPEGITILGNVSFIYTPSNFWVCAPGHPNHYTVQDWEHVTTQHFNSVPDAPRIEEPTEGSIVAVPVHEENGNVKWVRGLIVKINQVNGTVIVRHVDYGGNYVTPISDIRPLLSGFAGPRFRASFCCLNDVIPRDGEWSEEAREEFRRLTQSTHSLMIHVVSGTSDCYNVSLFRLDAESNAYVDIASDLVRRGFATRPPILPVFPHLIPQQSEPLL